MAQNTMNNGLGLMEDAARDVEQSVDIDNPNPRCITVMLIDESQSTERFSAQLEQAFPQFISSVHENEMDETIELGVITFNRTPSVVFPIQELYKYLDEESAPKLHLNPRGRTHTGEAVLAALDAIDNRMKLLCDRLGSHTFVPVLFILTDGNPFFCENEIGRKQAEQAWEEAAAALKQRVSQNQLKVIAIGVGDRINDQNLQILSGDSGETVRLSDNTDFTALFSCVSAEMVSASRGQDVSSSRITLKLSSS